MEELLKSVEDGEYVKDVTKRTENMSSACKFNLMKSMSFNKSVLMNIPESHRRKRNENVGNMIFSRLQKIELGRCIQSGNLVR